MRSTRFPFCVGSILIFAITARGQDCVDISTGFDQAAGTVLADGATEDEYTILIGGTPFPAYAQPANPAWVANDDFSRWIGPDALSDSGDPGLYVYEIRVVIPEELDSLRAVISGKWAVDDGGNDVIVNGTPLGIPNGSGFATMVPFPDNAGLGLFWTGENTIQFVVLNAGDALNPTGLRVEACITVPLPPDRPHNVSTGFDRSGQSVLFDGAEDVAFEVTGPDGSGIGTVQAVTVSDDGFPIPPWYPTNASSRWIGLPDPDSSGPAGEYRYVLDLILPPGFGPDAVLRGKLAADERISDVLINGAPTGIAVSGAEALSSFPIDAGRGLFRDGANTVEFIVVNDAEGPTGLRVDGEVVATTCPAPEEPVSALYTLDTGYDQEIGLTLLNGSPDDGYVLLGSPGSDLCKAFATVVNDAAWPVPPWVASSGLSKWIGPAVDTIGPGGVYTFSALVKLPEGFAADEARIVGGWTSDNETVDIIVNGASTGITNAGGFDAVRPFPDGAGLGLFAAGLNLVEFLVSNATAGPIGLRVEAVVGTEAPRPGDASTGIGPRGIGPLPGGSIDLRYLVTGPAGGPIKANVLDGAVIPGTWRPSSESGKWIGWDGFDPAGPAGTSIYDGSFVLGPEINPARVRLQGGWAAAGQGTDVLVNGVSIGLSAPGPAVLTPFTSWNERDGFGIFVQGLNVLRFAVENPTAGPTGLLVEASFGLQEEGDGEISSGYDQSQSQAIPDGEYEDEYSVTDPDGVTGPAFVVPLDGYPVPPWCANTAVSRWIGVPPSETDIGSDSLGIPGLYVFTVGLPVAADGGQPYLVGGWATDDQGADIRINGVSTGVTSTGGFGGLTMFPPEFGLGILQAGDNVIEFHVVNGGTAANSVGLRVDAFLLTKSSGSPWFLRGDTDASGKHDLTDAIVILTHLFLGGDAPVCFDAADVDDSGKIDLTDPIGLLTFMFMGGGTPAFPYPDCGADGTPDDLGCGQFASCL
jgi:hypothetical protein